MRDNRLGKTDKPLKSLKTQISTNYSFSTIQAGRGIAALLVVLYHLSAGFGSEKYWGFDPLHNIFGFGYAGVHFFFVLSGFIMLYIHRSDFGRSDRLKTYWKKRLVRIYPFYWLVLGLMVPVYFFIPSFGLGGETGGATIVSSFTLIHFGENQTILAVAWTLYHEMLFYFVFAFLILHRAIGLSMLLVWFLASAVSIFINVDGRPLNFYISPYNLLFGMGMAVSWLVDKYRVPFPGVLAAIGTILFLGVGMEHCFGSSDLSEDARSLLYGVGGALGLAGFVTLERQKLIRAHPLLCLFGDASYSIYLTHTPLISVLVKLFYLIGGKSSFPVVLSFVLLFSIVVASGVFVHLIIEKPLLKRISQLIRP